MTMGARIRALRTHLELSGDKFGELCDVTRGAVSQWENDLTRPTLDNLMKLREQRRFSIDWILTGDGEMVSPDKGLYVSDPRISAIASTLMRCMEERRDYIVDATQKELAASIELGERAEARAKAKDC